VADRAQSETGQADLDRAAVDVDRRTRAASTGLLPEPLRSGLGELERVCLDQRRRVATRLDPRHDPEGVQQLAHLLRGRPHHRDVTRGRIAEVVGPLERVREAGDRRERRPQVVARERHELRVALRRGHERHNIPLQWTI
jgi:hypothetical protein